VIAESLETPGILAANVEEAAWLASWSGAR
jgi:hypothetical protein